MRPTSFPANGYSRTVIVGAGQAGLAMAHALIEKGQRPQKDFLVLDGADAGTTSWRRRWHSLTLFTPAWYSGLPGLPFPGDPAAHPRADEVADYLDRYRERFGIEPMWNVSAAAVSVQPHGRGLTVHTDAGEIGAENVVAATGPFTHPRVPALTARVHVAGANMHSGQYTHPEQIPPGTVLVVGAGNTGLQIARELSGSHDVLVAAGAKQPELPQQLLGRDLFVWLRRTGALSVPASVLGKRMREREVVIGESLGQLEEVGVRVKPRVVGASGERVSFADGSQLRPTSVVWATGFAPGTRWLPASVQNEAGAVHTRGVTPIRGLFVLGMPWQSSRGSALLGGVGKDAARIARAIGDRP
jgi:putative flavoprotein involved in K+ transport